MFLASRKHFLERKSHSCLKFHTPFHLKSLGKESTFLFYFNVLAIGVAAFMDPRGHRQIGSESKRIHVSQDADVHTHTPTASWSWLSFPFCTQPNVATFPGCCDLAYLLWVVWEGNTHCLLKKLHTVGVPWGGRWKMLSPETLWMPNMSTLKEEHMYGTFWTIRECQPYSHVCGLCWGCCRRLIQGL